MVTPWTRSCDLWASMYRSSARGAPVYLRVPCASVRTMDCALQLLKSECWDALRWWSRFQPKESEVFVAFLAGCESVSAQRFSHARTAFLQAERVADQISACLVGAGMDRSALEGPAELVYLLNVAALFGSHAQPDDEYFFLLEAGRRVEDFDRVGRVDRVVHQRIWSLVFEAAVQVKRWDDASSALSRIDRFEPHLRLLGKKLRTAGKMELMLNLPDERKKFFLNSVYEDAVMSPPVVGSDSLTCYRLLYSLHFGASDHLKAASVAYALYAALAKLLGHLEMKTPHDADVGSFNWAEAGHCFANPEKVPAWSPHSTATRQQTGLLHEPGSFCVSGDLWPLLEQQRNALLMLINALSLAPGTLVVPQSTAARAVESAPCINPAEFAMEHFDELCCSFQEAGRLAEGHVISLHDAERRLAAVEARMAISGSSDVSSSTDVASKVASLGLLGLALQIAKVNGLDVWHVALKPFTLLCVEADSGPDSAVTGLADTARGPPQAYMFVNSDGCEPLGTGGSLREGLWNMLEAALKGEEHKETSVRSASNIRLYSLVADEILGSSSRLPRFLAVALAKGAWTCLLRLYMKHQLWEDAVDLLGDKLRCASRLKRPQEQIPVDEGLRLTNLLDDFPVLLVVQLHRCLEASAKTQENRSSELLVSLKAISEQFQGLLREREIKKP